ncbi:unnamed protein product, partial [Gadus morhua 'NCC']
MSDRWSVRRPSTLSPAVANQVVQAVVTQKDLREECVKLRGRVQDLEQQNRALSVLFQQQLRPTSDLLLQKLHSRILGLSAGDLLSDPTPPRARGPGLLHAAPHTHEVQLNGKAGLPVSRCLSQLSLSGPMGAFQHSSCSSSELSLSSACSDFSSGSFTWNEGRPFGKMPSLGSSAPGNPCAPAEDPAPAQRKESHILEGLRKLQRRKHRSAPSSSSKISKAGVGKDCMNSNEGIYSLGIKSGAKGVSKPPYLGRASALGGAGGSRKASYDSDDDADDESMHRARGDALPGKDNWSYCRRLSRSISDSLCSWEGLGDLGGGGGGGGGGVPAGSEHPRGYDFEERPEKLTSFVSSFLPGLGRRSAFTRVSLLGSSLSERVSWPGGQLTLSDSDDPEQVAAAACLSRSEQVESDARDAAAAAARLPERQCLWREQRRTRSAEARPRPFSLLLEPRVHQRPPPSEEEEEEEERLSVRAGPHRGVQASRAMADDTDPCEQERPTRQKAGNGRKHTAVHPSPEKPSACPSKATTTGPSREGGAERLGGRTAQQRKLLKPPGNRADEGQSVPPAADPSRGSRLPGQSKSVSPLRLSKGCSTEPSYGDRAPRRRPPPPWPGPPRRRRLPPPDQDAAGRGDRAEQPTRDRHCEPPRSPPSPPPPPPGRSASLLVKPGYEGPPQAHKTQASTTTTTTVRGPPPRYHPPPAPNTQPPVPLKARDSLELDAGYGTALAPQKLVDKTGQHLPAATQTPTKGTSRRTAAVNYLPSANSGCPSELAAAAPPSSKDVPQPYGALRAGSFQGTFVTRRGPGPDAAKLRPCSSALPGPDRPQPPAKQQDGGVASPPGSVVGSPSRAEKASKTRIPTGFKAFLRSPTGHKNGPLAPGKQEKDHISSVSKETVISNAPSVSSAGAADTPARPWAAGEVQARVRSAERGRNAPPEEASDGGTRGSLLFLRSISVGTKPHLKPAMGMTGAKARSQSFSANYLEKPHGGEPPGKTRTHIITNSGERGTSLSRQSSLEGPAAGPGPQSPLRSPGTRVSYYGGMAEETAPGVVSPRAPKPGSVGSPEGPRSAPVIERRGLRNVRKPSKVASHPQCYASSFGAPASSESRTLLITAATPRGPHKPDQSGRGPETQPGPADGPDGDEKKTSRTSCTMEEKVMMGIEENLQKCQEQEKVSASEAKQKTGPSLANWFGLRRSKLPALGGRKTETPKGKEDKKEVKTPSGLGVRPARSDKKKEKRRSDCGESVEGQKASPTSNTGTGQTAAQPQSTAGFMGKDALEEELLGRTGSMGPAPEPSVLPCITTAAQQQQQHQQQQRSEGKEENEIHSDEPKFCLMSLDKEGVPDHVIGSSCQMRTLDSGIGTFPPRDPWAAAPLPQSQSSPGGGAVRAGGPCSPWDRLLRLLHLLHLLHPTTAPWERRVGEDLGQCGPAPHGASQHSALL